MLIEATSDLWWKNAVVYCLDVETFADSDGDGCGDFVGLTRHLDYLAALGVTCIWLMPFYPTPDLDDGYDVTDFYGVDPRLGTLGDFVAFVRTASDRGIRVIADLIVNHTSDQHPWFRSARTDRDSPYRDYYVWRDEPGPEPDGLVFPDAEDSVWQYDEEAGQYYLHMFYRHQPDLNVSNPVVRDEIAKIMGFWLEVGVAGFRVDAVPFFLDDSGLRTVDGADPHEYLRDLRRFLNRRQGSAVLVGEVNLEPEQQLEFFGESADELHTLFNFNAMQAMYLSLARRDATALRETLRGLPPAPADSQWANFVRNHDELTLDKLTDEEREEVFAAFGPQEHMQLFGRGLRRRLPPMLGGDQARIRCVYSLMLTLPGTPVLFYGEEIGMGENLEIEGRLSVRTPMQWDDGPTGGFSAAAPDELVHPLPGGDYCPAHVNVAAQRRDPGSLLGWMERALHRRRESPEIGWGAWAVLDTGSDAVLAIIFDWDGTRTLALHNLSPDPATVTVDLADHGGSHPLRELFSDIDYGSDDVDPAQVDLAGYGYRWLRHSTT
jgi:trehalose synthase